MRGNGTKGQTVAAETFTPDRKAKSMIAVRDFTGLEAYVRGQRVARFDSPDMKGKTAYEHGLYLCVTGIVSPLSVEKHFEALEIYEIFKVAADGDVA